MLTLYQTKGKKLSNILLILSPFQNLPCKKENKWYRKHIPDNTDDIYSPTYTDILRVAFTSQFHRGKLSDLVNLLSGRNFETRDYEEEIAEKSYDRLHDGVLKFINKTNLEICLAGGQILRKTNSTYGPDVISFINNAFNNL